MAIPIETTVKRSDEIMHSDLGDQVVMMDVDAGAYFGLNAVGARIWAMAGEAVALTEVVDRLTEEFDVERAECEEAVAAFADDMVAQGIFQVVAAS